MDNDYLNQIQRAVDYFEDNLTGKVTIGEIAQVAGMSQWHFQRIFRAITGDTVKEYIRKRRLSYAATELRMKSEVKILDLALDCQFDSQESFSRAFKKLFALTPKQMKTSKSDLNIIGKIRIDRKYLEHINKDITMNPKITEREDIKLVGIGVQFTGVFSEGGKTDTVVFDLWGRFKKRIEEIPHRIGDYRLGVVDCYPTDSAEESDENLIYFACVEVERFAEIPDGMRAIILPKCRYANFLHKGEPHDIDQTLKYIYGSWLPKSGFKRASGPDIEFLAADFPERKELEYWIPLK